MANLKVSNCSSFTRLKSISAILLLKFDYTSIYKKTNVVEPNVFFGLLTDFRTRFLSIIGQKGILICPRGISKHDFESNRDCLSKEKLNWRSKRDFSQDAIFWKLGRNQDSAPFCYAWKRPVSVTKMGVVACVGHTICGECRLINANEYLAGAYWLIFDCADFEQKQSDRVVLTHYDTDADIKACEVKAFGKGTLWSTAIRNLDYLNNFYSFLQCFSCGVSLSADWLTIYFPVRYKRIRILFYSFSQFYFPLNLLEEVSS